MLDLSALRRSHLWRDRDIHTFQALNTLSYQTALGNPLILFAREVGANAFVIGVITGLPPLLGMLQLPMARRMARTGYQQTMLAGWTGRVLSLLLLCALPILATVLPSQVIVVGIVLTMVLFNVLRGLGSGAWLPWITALVSRAARGAFLARDRSITAIAGFTAMALSGTILNIAHRNDAAMFGFAVVFIISFVTGLVSLYYLKRIPNPKRPDEAAPQAPNVRWRDVLGDGAFSAFTRFSVVWQIIMASAGSFVIVFMRDALGIPDGTVVWLSAGAGVAAMIALVLVRNQVDARGSKIFQILVIGWWAIYFLLWLGMAVSAASTSAVSVGQWLAPAVVLVNGFFAAVFEMATTRLLMNTAGDRPGSSQYFAAQQVQISLAAGLAPIVWGAILDALGRNGFNAYAIFFGAQLILIVVLAWLWRNVREARAA